MWGTPVGWMPEKIIWFEGGGWVKDRHIELWMKGDPATWCLGVKR